MMRAVYRAFLPDSWAGRAYYAVVAAFLVVLIWQLFDRAPPSRVLEREIVTEQVRPCEMLQVRNKMVRDRDDTSIEIFRTLYDGFNLRHDFGVESRPAKSLPVGEEIYLAQVPISCMANPGPSRLESTVCWARTFNFVHLFWPVCVRLKTVNFTILRAPQ